MVGSESANREAERKRAYRLKLKSSNLPQLNSVNDNAWDKNGTNCPTDIDKDIDKDIDIEKEKIYKKEKDSKLNNTYEDEFEKLWKLYPRKEGKQVAYKVYLSLRKKNEVTFQQVEKGILAYIQELKRNRTQDKFILHGSTYFNQRRWEDELPEVETKTEKLVTEEEQDFFDRFE